VDSEAEDIQENEAAHTFIKPTKDAKIIGTIKSADVKAMEVARTRGEVVEFFQATKSIDTIKSAEIKAVEVARTRVKSVEFAQPAIKSTKTTKAVEPKANPDKGVSVIEIGPTFEEINIKESHISRQISQESIFVQEVPSPGFLDISNMQFNSIIDISPIKHQPEFNYDSTNRYSLTFDTSEFILEEEQSDPLTEIANDLQKLYKQYVKKKLVMVYAKIKLDESDLLKRKIKFDVMRKIGAFEEFNKKLGCIQEEIMKMAKV
jgi:hypothetical protein